MTDNKFGLSVGDLVKVDGWGQAFFKLIHVDGPYAKISTVKYGKVRDVQFERLRPHISPKKRHIYIGKERRF